MIQGYPEQPTILPRDKLILHVSTDAPQFRVDFYRQSQTLDFKSSSAWLPGQNSPAGSSGQDWGWPGYPISIPNDWTSGAYIAVFVEGDANGNQISFPDTSNADGRDSKALFVVKSVEPGTNASILFKVSLNTHHAYNYSGGGSLYQTQAPSDPGDPFGEKVTMLRPGGGTGGAVTPFPPYPDLDIYNPGTSPQGFAHWEPLLIGWLERNGYQVDYCTDLDIHEDTDLHLLNSYHLLLSVGHDEYWSEEMRAHVETFIQNGGNVAFFSGNTCWWRIHYVDNNTAFVCDHGTGTDQWWKATPVVRPENTLTGVSYRCAGGDWGSERTPVGYQVQHADHWVYEGTGLHNGDVFGKNEHLVGYECDGAFFDNQQDSQGFFIPTGQDQTPLNFTILGVGLLDGTGWKSLPQPPNDREKELVGSNAATMGMYTNNGTVFTAATTDWIRVLAQGKEPAVEQITRNVLNRLRVLSTVDLHLTGVTNDGKLWHTVRFANGSWQPSFGDVKAQESNDPGPLYAVDCGADGGDLDIIAATNVLDVTRGGKLWHTIRFANGSWQPSFGDVKAQESNDPGHFYEDISCAAAFGILHVCGITTGDGQLWHTIRFADGTWQSLFDSVDSLVPSIPGAFFGVGCAVVDTGDLHVVTITSADPGTNPADLYHTIRFVDGSWQPFGNVKAQESNDPGPFSGISCAAAGGDLHVVGATSDGKLWHTIRFANGSWQAAFGDVKAQESNDPGPFTDNISCAVADNGDLHVVGATSDGKLWHTIRFANGSWQPSFGDVKAQESNDPGPFIAVGIASHVNFIM